MIAPHTEGLTISTLASKVIVITGGTGSFGNAAAARFLEAGADEVRIFGRDELKQEVMRQRFADERLRFYLGDVRDRASVDRVTKGADLVFHAAALKQVPSCEFFPMQAVMTNVNGSDNVLQSCLTAGVSSVVCLGTDKAAYPINAMGMTKALMEKVAQAAARLTDGAGRPVVSTVRYGNVIASRGSVVPLFAQQAQSGGPLTITEPTMTRFLLPLPRAIDLVLFAFVNAKPGDLFVRKAPAATVGDMATAVQRIFGVDREQRTIGMRHGEKLFETLATAEELARGEDLGEYIRVSMDDRELNYSLYFTQGDPERTEFEDYTSHNARRLSVKEVMEVLIDLPEVKEQLRHWRSGGPPAGGFRRNSHEG